MQTPSAVLRQFVDEVWNKNDRDAVHRHLHADFRHHMPGLAEPLAGPAAYQMLVDAFTAAFGDHRMEIHNVFGEGEHACIEWTFVGVHRGAFQEFRPTGRTIRVAGVGVAVVGGGKIREVRSLFDNEQFVAQLEGGAASPSPSAKQVVESYTKAVTHGDIEALGDWAASDIVAHQGSQQAQGLAALEHYARTYRQSIEGWEICNDALLSEGDWVAVRGRTRGKIGGEPIEFPFLAQYRVAGGKVAEVHLAGEALSGGGASRFSLKPN